MYNSEHRLPVETDGCPRICQQRREHRRMILNLGGCGTMPCSGTPCVSHPDHAASCPSSACRASKAVAVEASPTACIIDFSECEKSLMQAVGLASTATAFDARQADQGQEAACSGCDTQGLLLHGIVPPPPTFRIMRRRSLRCWQILVQRLFHFQPVLRIVHHAVDHLAYQRRAGLSPRAWPASCPISETRDRQADSASGEGLRSDPAQALGGRTHHRLARAAAADWPGLGEPQPQIRARQRITARVQLFKRGSCSENSD